MFASGSLKASRKRPVSVDTDISPPRQVSGGTVGPVPVRNGGGGGMEGDGGHSMLYNSLMGSDGGQVVGYSNRNSHPFTEREVEQGFQQMQGQSWVST